ncbi:MAG: hypothetical protein B6D37_01370 [Sphingobacteriales bacterium UTBCD1]|jgi:signal transduction histidine kinase|nr:MAG: hypothetical protein B6D37_01370 [Sphingobacteriales bacterium UTBCD1]
MLSGRWKILCLSFLLLTDSFAQQKEIDSLSNQLKSDLPDTTRALSLMRLAYYYETIDTEKSAQAYQNAIAFTKNKKLDYQAANIYFNQSYLFYAQGKYQEASASVDTALIFLENSSHPNTAFKRVQVYGQMSGIYKMLNDYEKSIEYQLKANEMNEKLNRLPELLVGYINTSVLYKEMLDYHKQEEYARKVLAIAKETSTNKDFFLAYMYIGYSLAEQNNHQEARKYLDSSRLFFNKDENYQPNMLISYYLINGEVFFMSEKYDSSYQYFKMAYDLGKEKMQKYGEYHALVQMGNVLRKEKKFMEAEKLLLQAYEEIYKTGELAQKNTALEYLSNLYEDWGDTKKSLKYYKDFKKVSDSIVNDKNKKLAISLEKQYENEKKEATIKLQQVQIKDRKRLNYLLGGVALALVIISLLTYRTYHQKQKLHRQRISELETEQKLNATEAVLKGEEQERARLAKDLHDGLSGMLSGVKYSLQDMKGNLIMAGENRQAFERSIDMLDSSIKEMRRVAHNMMPEVLVRYGLDAAMRDYISEINKSGIVNIVYQSMGMAKKEMERSSAIAVYRIVQELVNNVIKHARATEVLVQLFGENDKLVVNVEDNGKGFDTKLSEGQEGMGWKNIRSRVELLKGTIDIHSSPEKGTSVNLEFNIV